MREEDGVYLWSKSSIFGEGIFEHLMYIKGLTLITDLWEASRVLLEQNIWIQLRSNLKACTEEWDGRRMGDARSW